MPGIFLVYFNNQDDNARTHKEAFVILHSVLNIATSYVASYKHNNDVNMMDYGFMYLIGKRLIDCNWNRPVLADNVNKHTI